MLCRTKVHYLLPLVLSAVLPLGASCTAPEGPASRGWEVPAAQPGGEARPAIVLDDIREALDAMPADYAPRTHHLGEDGSPEFSNRLSMEGSPYLIQHAHNPVDWYPWGDEAFEAARRLDRPVLLSVGYSTCHWCHVMERESFEDLEIAAFINTHFVAIKVDREERPDVDAVYMDAVHALAGRGGWPMTVMLTPGREPFFAGTYFPARDGDRGARRGFLSILKTLSDNYADNPDAVVAQAARITSRLQAAARAAAPAAVPGDELLQKAVQSLKASFDQQWGGFGRAPKFPRSVMLDMLLRYHRRSGDERALEMVVITLERMLQGGVYDQVGGGFHRYSTDSRWLVPHFEKMLYDNALIASTLVEAWQVSGRDDFARVAREILDYVLREMTDEAGGFYSATDADSPAPGGHEEEGLYFTWTPGELDEALGKDEGEFARNYWSVTEGGNFEGRSILYVDHLAAAVDRERLDAIRTRLYELRADRQPPGLDDKVLTAWNGLMISALAKAGRALGEPRYVDAAVRAGEFLVSQLRYGNRLRRSWKSGKARHDGVLDDYAFLVAALLDLYETDHDRRWLELALELQGGADEEFLDETTGGYFLSPASGENLLVRKKPTYDGARPSGNSVMISNLMRLYEFTTDEQWKERAERALGAFATALARYPAGSPRMLSALDYYLDSPKEIILVRAADDDDLGPFTAALSRTYLPNCIVAAVTEGEQAHDLAGLVPLVGEKTAIDGKVTAYVCENRVCKFPTTDPEKFAELISTVKNYQ